MKRGEADRANQRLDSDVLKLVSGTTLAQVAAIAAAPILTRLYSPADFGVLGIFTSISAIFGVLACLRYDLAVYLPEGEDDAAALLILCVVAAFAVSILLFPLLLLLPRGILTSDHGEGVGPFVWLIPASVFLTGAFAALNAWCSRLTRYGRLSIARVLQSAATTGSQLICGLAGLATVSTLIWTAFGGQIIAVALMLTASISGKLSVIRFEAQWTRIRQVAVRHRRFPLVELPGAFLNAVSQNAPFLLLAWFFSESVVGYFALTYRLIALPITLIGGALSQVYFQRASATRDAPAAIAELSTSLLRRMIAITLLPSVMLAVIGPELFEIMFGLDWVISGKYAQILAPWVVGWLVGSTLSVIFAVLERQDLALLVHVSLFIFRVAPMVIGGLMGSEVIALVLFSVSNCIVYAGIAVWSLRLAGVPMRSALAPTLRHFQISCLVGITVWALKIGGLDHATLVAITILLLAINFSLYGYEELRRRRA